MVANKHITAIVVTITAIAVALCFLAIGFSDSLNDIMGGEGVNQEYEYRLFDTDELIEIDIRMDEDEWNTMLANATSELYYVCDVVINGQKLYNVAIRPKGNTSLSSIAMDPNNNRFSFKLEFDQYVKGQTCFGLDKLILNNNYADATNMKEAIIYDMFRYVGADASLYNYARITVNGEYWGVYLALEAVEDSFMLRNYGTKDGEMYKPDTLDMGGNDEDRGDSEDREAFENERAEGDSNGDSEGRERGNSEGDSADRNAEAASEEAPAAGQEATSADETVPEARVAESAEEVVTDTEAPAATGEGESAEDWTWDTEAANSTGNDTERTGSEGEERADSEGEEWGGSEGEEGESEGGEWEDRGDSDGGGWGAMGGGTNLNYTGDDLDNYNQIWLSEITNTTESDHKRVVTALKNISEGNNLERYMDIDNLVRFMAAHEFSVNSDSLSGNMAHNYYLYEYEGQLNMIPWDYNLALGGMGMGGSGSDLVNDAIDTPFDGTNFFDTLLANEEYLEMYHENLRKLVEYVKGGEFDKTYNRIRNQIDELVKTDPNAMYTYEEYEKACDMLYKVMNLRAESIEGQLDGTIPSTETGQRQNSSALIDASGINTSTMGTMSMGGGNSDGDSREGEAEGAEEARDGSSGDRASQNEAAEPAATNTEGESAEDWSAANAEGESAEDWTAANAEGESTGDWANANAEGESTGEWPTEENSESTGEQPARTVIPAEDTADAAVEEPASDVEEAAAPTEAEGEAPAGDAAPAADGESTGEWAEGEWPAANEDGESNGEWADNDGESSGDRASAWGGFGGTSLKERRNNNIITYAVGFGIVVIAIIGAALFKRRR